MRTLVSTLAVGALLIGLGAGRALAQTPPMPLAESFCSNNNGTGTYTPPGQTPDGASGNMILRADPLAKGSTYPPGMGCMSSDGGSFSWTLRHAQINVAGGAGTDGTEHGTFNFSNSAETVGAIFNGQVATFVNSYCTGDGNQSDCPNQVVYSSAGNYNSLKNNQGLTGMPSTVHVNGGYVVTITSMQDMTSGACHCQFDAELNN
jgi:hypothetical protein